MSLKQSGLNEEQVQAWNEQLDVAFDNLYGLCEGNSACEFYLDTHKEATRVADLGLNDELALTVVNLKHAIDIQQGNWGTL